MAAFIDINPNDALAHSELRVGLDVGGLYNRTDPLGLFDGTNPFNYVHGAPLTYIDENGQIAVLPAMALGFVGGAAWELGLQLINNGGNFECLDYKQILLSGAASMSLGGRLGYKATITGIRNRAGGDKMRAFLMRKRVKHHYRMHDRIRKVLSKRDPDFDDITDPLATAGKSNWKWDIGLVAPGAINLGGRAGMDRENDECGKCQ